MNSDYQLFFEQLTYHAGQIWLTLGLSGLLIFCLWQLRRYQSEAQLLSHRIALLQNEIRALNSGALGIGKKVQHVATELASTDKKLSFQQTSQAPNQQVYEQAAVLLERGATIEEIAGCCDLPPAEVELLAVIHHSGKAHRASQKRARQSAGHHSAPVH